MRWYVRLKEETSEYLYIEYSHETNDNCDGLLKYDKQMKDFTIEKMSLGVDEFGTKWVFAMLRDVIHKNKLNEKKRVIAIG